MRVEVTDWVYVPPGKRDVATGLGFVVDAESLNEDRTIAGAHVHFVGWPDEGFVWSTGNLERVEPRDELGIVFAAALQGRVPAELLQELLRRWRRWPSAQERGPGLLTRLWEARPPGLANVLSGLQVGPWLGELVRWVEALQDGPEGTLVGVTVCQAPTSGGLLDPLPLSEPAPVEGEEDEGHEEREVDLGGEWVLGEDEPPEEEDSAVEVPPEPSEDTQASPEELEADEPVQPDAPVEPAASPEPATPEEDSPTPQENDWPQVTLSATGESQAFVLRQGICSSRIVVIKGLGRFTLSARSRSDLACALVDLARLGETRRLGRQRVRSLEQALQESLDVLGCQATVCLTVERGVCRLQGLRLEPAPELPRLAGGESFDPLDTGEPATHPWPEAVLGVDADGLLRLVAGGHSRVLMVQRGGQIRSLEVQDRRSSALVAAVIDLGWSGRTRRPLEDWQVLAILDALNTSLSHLGLEARASFFPGGNGLQLQGVRLRRARELPGPPQLSGESQAETAESPPTPSTSLGPSPRLQEATGLPAETLWQRARALAAQLRAVEAEEALSAAAPPAP